MIQAEEEFKEIKQSEMKEDAMKSLEYRTYDSKRELDILDALDQVKNLNRREGLLNHDDIMDKAIHSEMIEDISIAENGVKDKFDQVRNRRIDDFTGFSDDIRTFDMTQFGSKDKDEDKDEDDEDYSLSKSFSSKPLTALKIKKKIKMDNHSQPQHLSQHLPQPQPLFNKPKIVEKSFLKPLAIIRKNNI